MVPIGSSADVPGLLVVGISLIDPKKLFVSCNRDLFCNTMTRGKVTLYIIALLIMNIATSIISVS